MAITQAKIDALEDALTSGELEVEYDGKRTKFRSIDELRKALAYAKEELSGANYPGASYAQFSKD